MLSRNKKNDSTSIRLSEEIELQKHCSIWEGVVAGDPRTDFSATRTSLQRNKEVIIASLQGAWLQMLEQDQFNYH